MRLRVGVIVAVIAALAFTVLAAGATAARGPAPAGAPAQTPGDFLDPQTTNVPYTAWNGQQLKLVKCLDISAADQAGIQSHLGVLPGRWLIEDWSGSTNPFSGPRLEDDVDGYTEAFIAVHDQDELALCWAVNITSLKPGLAVVKLVVSLPPEFPFFSGIKILKHQFLVIWMSQNAPVLEELRHGGDPTGTGEFIPPASPPFLNGKVRVTVTGSFPLGNNFEGILPGNVATLPRDWAALAARLAVENFAPNPGPDQGAGPASRWDIHDDNLLTENHSPATVCGPPFAAIDAVDNCLGGGEFDLFSRLVGFTFPTIGPFDPLWPSETLLLDGKLDAGDAPMPEARIDVSIVGGNAGGLEEADKHVNYSRNGLGSPTPHNLYAPFYGRFIPATSGCTPSGTLTFVCSGTDGALITNNFPGYLVNGLYHYWDFALAERFVLGNNDCRNVLGQPIPRQFGWRHVVVYSDEHGIAEVEFNPNQGFTLAVNEQGVCPDFFRPGQIGTSVIQAEAKYPDQPVFEAARVSNQLTKRIFSRANKTLNCIPKPSEPTRAVICWETILDIFGRPIGGAPVRFTTQPALLELTPFARDSLAPLIRTAQQGPDTDPSEFAVQVTTDPRSGQAAVEITHTLPECVDVKAENVGTRNGARGFMLTIAVRFFADDATTVTIGPNCAALGAGGTPAPGGSNNPPQSNPPSGQNNPQGGNQPQSQPAVIVSLGGSPTPSASQPATPAAAARASLASARLVVIKGKRYLVVRVKGSAKTAKLRIQLITRQGKALRPIVRTVPTNRAARVPGLVIGKSVKTVRVSIA